MGSHTDVIHSSCDSKTAPTPDPAHISIWIALNRARLSVMRDVDKKLRTEGLPPLTWYDVLWAIEMRGGAARPAEIVEDLLFEPSALSHMTKRMEAAGLLRICIARDDKRGRVLRLTPAGAQARLAIWQIYGTALETQLRALNQLADPDAVSRALNAVVRPDPD